MPDQNRSRPHAVSVRTAPDSTAIKSVPLSARRQVAAWLGISPSELDALRERRRDDKNLPYVALLLRGRPEYDCHLPSVPTLMELARVRELKAQRAAWSCQRVPIRPARPFVITAVAA